MRQIGTIPKTSKPQVFVDHLLALGVTSRAVESPDGWAIWVHNEDLVPKARAEFDAFRADPDDDRFRSAAKGAAEVRRESERRDRLFRKNVREVASTWSGLRFRRRPLTVVTVAVCVALFVAGEANVGWKVFLFDKLQFSSLRALSQPDLLANGLDDLRRGEVWRLFTPALLHGDVIHLALNMWAFWSLGSLLEARRGTAGLAALMLVSAAVSAMGQYLWMVHYDHRLNGWVGLSGVVFALFGYVWIKGRLDPEFGLSFGEKSVRFMLFWLLLGLLGVFKFANGAHLFGLIVGMLFGFAGF